MRPPFCFFRLLNLHHAIRGISNPQREIRQCVALQAQYVLDTFGKFPGTVPSIFLIMHLQAHHLHLECYDRFFKPGSCLKTHADHMKTWRPEG